MKEAQQKQIEKRLREERERTMEALRHSDAAAHTNTEDDGDLTSYTQHLADEGTDTMEQEKALLMLSAEGQRLAAIDEALDSLIRKPEDFGKCAACGNEISMERLDLVPWTQYCRDHQARHEKGS